MLPRGSRVSVTASVTSATASSALVDLEIYDPAGVKVFQRHWDNQAFAAGQTRSYSASWLVPTTETPGTYVVKIGVFKSGWAALYNWNDGAAVFTAT